MITMMVLQTNFELPDSSLVLLQEHNIENIREYLVKNNFKWSSWFKIYDPLSDSKNFKTDSIILIDQNNKTISELTKDYIDIITNKTSDKIWDKVLDIIFVEL